VLALNPFPWQEILGTTSKLGCDAILIVSHGRRGAAQGLLGS
jgi:nucleotide-binding universal stress UspA family protein